MAETTTEQIATLIDAYNKLSKEYTELKEYYEKVHDDIEQRVSAVDKFIQEGSYEPRYVQDITIGGSTEFFYPVWFVFQGNNYGASKMTICRHYSWNGGEDERPLNSSRPHQAALLLEMEGNANGWSGDANFLEIKRFHERYNSTASHVSFVGYCKWKKTGTIDRHPENTLGKFCPRLSTVYLRGGGLTYRIIKNWQGDIQFSDTHNKVDITSHVEHGTWYVEPIPLADRIAPKVSVDAFVDPE
ncbi:MAG: phage tail protein [Candidatus Electrothrix sp. LOE1_4_5]|nr:phage tail protein [Candidatus Electrothrix gigas]